MSTKIFVINDTSVTAGADNISDLGTSSIRWKSLYIINIIPDTSTGLKIGTATTQKIGFFNATPIVQPASTTDLRTLLINLGLLATGGASPLNLNGGAITAGDGNTIGGTTITDAKNIVVGSTTGTKIGTATTQKIGFFNATPIVQPTTAGTASTFVSNTSGIVDDSATFDGYTLGQIVKALRNIGVLA